MIVAGKGGPPPGRDIGPGSPAHRPRPSHPAPGPVDVGQPGTVATEAPADRPARGNRPDRRTADGAPSIRGRPADYSSTAPARILPRPLDPGDRLPVQFGRRKPLWHKGVC